MAKKKKMLGDILIEWGLINQKQLDEAEKLAEAGNRRLSEILVEMDLVSEDQVTKAMARQFDLEYVDLSHQVVDRAALDLVPESIIRQYQILPIGHEGNKIKLLIHDPLDLDTLDLLRFRLNSELDCALAPREKIKSYIDNHFDPLKDTIDKTLDTIDKTIDASVDSSIDKSIDLDNLDPNQLNEDSAPIVKLINKIIDEAVKTRASDIHIEPMADRVRVRYRIDGVCVERNDIPKALQAVVTTRFKIMSGMDIAERRVPQDGRIKKRVGSSDIDFRVSALPAYHGESIVLRILRPDSVLVGIQALGFADDDYEKFQKIIRRPNGIFLVTGPTGSGKTTTLYSALQVLNRPDKKIITAEDPVEYNFAGMNQCQVRHEIGFDFARILRSMLRQAPNIILVGEIRDREVADIAIQAALTGHLVFSTLHTNDAPSAVTRMIDMGVKPFLVASAIQAIMGQRLVRVTCKDCKEVDPNPDRRYLRLVGFDPDNMQDITLYKGVGCKRCNGTGYRGRIGIFEMMMMNARIRELAFQRSPVNEIRNVAIASGMRTLVEDGKLKCMSGLTTVAEVARVAQVSGLVDDVDIDDGE